MKEKVKELRPRRELSEKVVAYGRSSQSERLWIRKNKARRGSSKARRISVYVVFFVFSASRS